MEEKQRQLEERGVAVEKALRGEAGNSSSVILAYIDFFIQFGFLCARAFLISRIIDTSLVNVLQVLCHKFDVRPWS